MVFGREKDDLICPIALANLVLLGVDEPHIWHGNSLTGGERGGAIEWGFESLMTSRLAGRGRRGQSGQRAWPKGHSALGRWLG